MEMFDDHTWVDMLPSLLATLVQYFLSLPRLPWQPDVPDESLKDVARFSLLGLEVRATFKAESHLAYCARCLGKTHCDSFIKCRQGPFCE